MNMEIGAEAALFPEKEYINGIFVAVWDATNLFLQWEWKEVGNGNAPSPVYGQSTPTCCIVAILQGGVFFRMYPPGSTVGMYRPAVGIHYLKID